MRLYLNLSPSPSAPLFWQPHQYFQFLWSYLCNFTQYTGIFTSCFNNSWQFWFPTLQYGDIMLFTTLSSPSHQPTSLICTFTFVVSYLITFVLYLGFIFRSSILCLLDYSKKLKINKKHLHFYYHIKYCLLYSHMACRDCNFNVEFWCH